MIAGSLATKGHPGPSATAARLARISMSTIALIALAFLGERHATLNPRAQHAAGSTDQLVEPSTVSLPTSTTL